MPASASSRHGRTLSPTAFSSATTGQQKLNIVTRVAIEGKARKGADGKAEGASIKMFLKLSIPADVAPGSTIPLFPEENVKILDANVHPLDSSSAPYNFSSATSTLLHRGARALNLPARSRVLYTSLFGSVSSSSSSSSNPPPIEERYVGHILVSGYNVSYVLPKEFPPRGEEMQSRSSGRRMSTAASMQFMAAINMWIPFLSKPPHCPYLLSIPTPRCLHNHIKLRIFPPISQSSISASLASLSSAEEDYGSWDLTSEPHVTRTTTPSRHSRSHSQQSYTHFADDESSDSSTAGFADGCGIQGTFQSAERIRIRWAKPMRPQDIPETSDGRRRVGVREVNGTTTCAVLRGASQSPSRGKGRSSPEGSIVMNVEYNATCKGVWSPGVATMLGMDVGLDVGDCDVDWAPEGSGKWTVSGSTGFTGFAIGSPPSAPTPTAIPPLSRQSSASDSTPFLLPSPDGRPSLMNGHSSQNAMRIGSSASLLRVPLPTQNVPDYSFEGSPSVTPTSSVASLATIPSSPERHRRSRASSVNDGQFTDTDIEQDAKPPNVPVTVHVNMNDLPPPSKNVLEFSISGTIVVTPRKPSSGSSSSPPPAFLGGQPESPEKNPVVLPRFRVLHCDKEITSVLVRSELNSESIDVYNATGKVSDAQSRKTVIQPGGQTRCGSEGARIAIRSMTQSPVTSLQAYAALRGGRSDHSTDEEPIFKTPRTNGLLASASMSVSRRNMLSPSILRPMRDGPLMIPSVTATVTSLLSSTSDEEGEKTSGYAVRVCLPAPSDANTEWLEFGLAIPSSSSPSSLNTPVTDPPATGPPKVQVVSASLEGVPVHFETTVATKPEKESSSPVGLPFEETSGKEWVTWVKVHIGESGGGKVEVVYLVKKTRETSEAVVKKSWWKGKAKANDSSVLDVLLPTFSLRVGRLEVDVEAQAGLEIQSVRSNLTHETTTSTGRRLVHYSMEEFFYPRLSIITTSPSPTPSTSNSFVWRTVQILFVVLPTAMALFLLANNAFLEQELAQAKQSLLTFPATPHIETITREGPATVTVTSTIVATTTTTTTTTTSIKSRADHAVPSSSKSDPPSTVTSTVYLPAPTPTLSSAPTFTPTPLTTPAAFDLAMRDLPFLWPVRLEFPSLEHVPHLARTTLSMTWTGIGAAWQLFRRVLHYP
ncbi:hypothetical protein BXZ70DRAFT_973965, partial [Cristinia sonorae]